MKNGHLQEKITDKVIDNGIVKINKKIYEGELDKGKLRKKRVTFLPEVKYIQPGYEDYHCDDIIPNKKTKRFNKKIKRKNKTKRRNNRRVI